MLKDVCAYAPSRYTIAVICLFRDDSIKVRYGPHAALQDINHDIPGDARLDSGGVSAVLASATLG